MRRLCLTLLAATVVLPAAALAASHAAGDGTFAVRKANGKAVVQGRGTIFGHLDSGRLVVTDYNLDDATDPLIFGAERKRLMNDSGTTWQYSGSNIRFKFFGGRYKFVVQGYGADISAVGKGIATVTGLDGVGDGDYSFNGDKWAPLDVVSVTATFGNTP